MSTSRQFRLFSFISLLLGMTNLAAQAQKNNFIIHGSIVDMPVQPAMVYLSYDSIMHKPKDSAVVRDGQYSFEGHIDEPVEVKIEEHIDTELHQGRRTTANETNFLIQPGDIQVVSTGTMNQAVVTGSPAEADFRQADEGVRLWGDSLRQLYQLGLKTRNQIILSSMLTEKNLDKVRGLMENGYRDFIHSHPASTANIFLIQKLIGIGDAAGSIDTVENLYQLLPVTMQTTYQGRIIGARLQDELKTAIGHQAPDFTQQDTAGHVVSLSSFKGKYVLLDFWVGGESDKGRYPLAPVLQKIYDTYAGKGLVVLGVSLDADRGAWLHAIHEKDLGSTIQVSDLKGRNNAVAQLYRIRKIPTGLLIDPHGMIVARGLTALNINKTLSAIFE
jgi:peroxiredoxin